jgi:predicted transport protein
VRILDLGNDIQIKPAKRYIAFRRKHNFLAVKTRKSMLRLILNIRKSELNDPLYKAREVEGTLSVVSIMEPNDIPYALEFIRQSYDKSLTR